MKPTKEQIEAYKEMAKTSPDSMKAIIEANLKATCDKYAGHEDRLDDCLDYLAECAKEILGHKNGEVDNETCYRICRDYFNDELWNVEEVKTKAEAAKIESKIQQAKFKKEKAAQAVKDAKAQEAKAKKEVKKAEKESSEFHRKEKRKYMENMAKKVTQDFEKEQLDKEREREKKANFEKVVGKWLKKKVRKNGLVVSIPVDIKSVQHQAKVLHQCLVSADYIGKMADRRCLLVFIVTREGAPVATAEILPSGKVGQFYGDERSRENEKMKPGKKAREALDAWIYKFKPKWRKAA